MTTRLASALFVALLGWGLLPGPAAAESPRIALVIGNSAYQSAPLANPLNDARLISETLRSLGFRVLEHGDLTQKAMKLAVREFGDALEHAGADAVGLFYYSGHGIQVQGRNYMVPVNADIRRESDIDIEAVAADIVLGTMGFARNRLNLVIMDACRNNPFARSFRSATRGLARMDATKGMLIAYSTSPGQVAVDGEGSNSPYTLALAVAMRRASLPVEQVFKEVRRSVMADTGNLQVPWESSSLTGDFYFSGVPSATVGSAVVSAKAGRGGEAEIVFWQTIKDSSDPADYEAYLQQFPGGVFAALAKSRGQQAALLTEPAARGTPADTRGTPADDSAPAGTADSGEAQPQARLSVPKAVQAGAPLSVEWVGPGDQRDLITIVEVAADSGRYGNYRSVREGSPLKIPAPEDAGDYEVRYLAGPKRRTLASSPVRVESVTASLSAPDTADAGSEIRIEWEGPGNAKDFVTVVEAQAEERAYGPYAYTRNGNPLKLRVPDSPGDYELRYLTGQQRKTLTRAPLRVAAVSVALHAPETVAAGARLKVEWEGPDNAKDFVTIVEADAEERKYGNYAYTREGSPLKLAAPDEPGDYQIRYLAGQSRMTLASTSIVVEPVSATLSGPAEVMAGAKFKVEWEGPDNDKDFVTIVEADAEERKYGNYAYTRLGSSLSLLAPDVPGEFQLRYLTGQSRATLATQALEVLAAEASLRAPEIVAAGTRFEVDWTGPDNKRDFITIVEADADERRYDKNARTREGNPLTLQAPDRPGRYELRYLTGQTRRTLARRAVIVE